MKKPVHFRKFARNRRAERTERQGAAGISKFLFWGEDLSGSFQGAGGVGGLVAHMEKPDSAGWTAYYYHPDANGNIAAVTSPFRALAAKFSYDAFGRTTSQSGPKSGIDIHALNYRFSTKPMELELATSNTTLVPPPVSSGLYYYGYRFYSPNLGRWISRDPIREQGGRNLYNFVGNDGVGKWDILGLEMPGPGDNLMPTPLPSPLTVINSDSDALQHYRSKAGGVLLAGTSLINDIKNSASYRHNKNMVEAAIFSELRKVPYDQNNGSIRRNGKTIGVYAENNSLGNVNLIVEPYIFYWDSTSWKYDELNKKCKREIFGSAERKISFSDDYDFVFEPNHPIKTTITDVAPGIYAGDGTPYKIEGSFTDEIKVDQAFQWK